MSGCNSHQLMYFYDHLSSTYALPPRNSRSELIVYAQVLFTNHYILSIVTVPYLEEG
jgi:hypothetical protein